MLINFFHGLRDAGVPVPTRELLDLLDELGVADNTIVMFSTDNGATWDALEAAYGSPPDRDFCAWKLDPRAWVATSECDQGDCRIDGDKVLIECALGARWGFYKFPPSPAIEDAVGAGLLTWREEPRETVVLDAATASWLEAAPSRVAIGIDLAWPLRDQIEQAKRIQAEALEQV